MSIWLWLSLGLGGGALPALLADARYRAWYARQCWRLSFGIAFVCLVLPLGLVLIMLLSAAAFDAIQEIGMLLLGEEFGWVTALTLGWLTGCGAMAWLHRHAPPLQGPPLSLEAMALAREPATQHEAIERYRHETGTDFPVAMDAVEAYLASQRGQPTDADSQTFGPLEWMHLGFAAAWYVALAIGFGLSLDSQANPFLVGLGFFVCVPGLFGGFCGVCGGTISAQTKMALRQNESLTRRFAFFTGLAASAVSIAGVLAVGVTAYSLSRSEVGVGFALAGIAAVLSASPFLGLWLLKQRRGRESL